MTTALFPLEVPGRVDRGLSEAAATWRKVLGSASLMAPTLSVTEPRAETFWALDRAVQEANVANWDGEGAIAVLPSTYRYAVDFINALPLGLAQPDVRADSDGDIVFEWDAHARRVFAVAVGRDGTLNYAGLFGYTVRKGTEMLRESLSAEIVDGIRQATEHV